MRRWLGLALLSAWMALPADARAAGQESLCLSPPSGATCICSEPLQGASYNVNPIDTTPPKECGNIDTGTPWTTQAVTGTTIARAHRATGLSTNNFIPLPSPVASLPATGTYTQRFAVRWSDDADIPDQPGSGQTERRKLSHIRLRYSDKALALNQIEVQVDPFAGDGRFMYDQISLPLDAGGTLACNGQVTVTNPIGSRPTMDDCRVSDNAWCVIEERMSGNFATGNTVTFSFDTWVVNSTGVIVKHERADGTACSFNESVQLLQAPEDGMRPLNAFTDLMDSGWAEVAYVGAWTSTSTDVVMGPPTEMLAAATCGDGAIEGAETCDDGGTAGGDGCSADCLSIESGWGCTGEPSVCTQIPVAAFSCSPTSDTTTTTVAVTCTDASTNTPTSWAWDVANNGSTDSTSQNPVFNFAPGVYTIRLRATNAGGYDDETKTNYVTITQSAAGSGTSIPSLPRVRLR